MNRSKIVAIVTGAISIILAIVYLIVVQILDYRDMKPAPIGTLNEPSVVITAINPANCQHLDQIVGCTTKL